MEGRPGLSSDEGCPGPSSGEGRPGPTSGEGRPGPSSDVEIIPPPPKRRRRTSSPTFRETDFMSPMKKRPRSALTPSEKLMVVNIYKLLLKSWPEGKYWSSKDCAKETAEVAGLSIASVYRTLKEYKMKETFTSPKKSGPKHNFKDKIDEFTFAAIRRKVHQFFYKNESPTVAKILQLVNDDPDLPDFKKSTMHKILKHLDFKYMTRKRKSLLIDRQDVALWRQRYLLSIKQYRREGRFIYYQDETWINEGHAKKTVWVDTKIETSRQAFLEGLTTGLKAPTGKGKRLIICHIGSEEGFLEDGLLSFEAKRGLEDYHKEMNAECFEEWFKKIVVKLKPNSVIVIDNAPYHSRKIESTPTSNWRKAKIQEWLTSKNIQYEENMTVVRLMEIVRSIKTNYEKMAIDEIAKQHGITLLRLPPYHCELNPIELVWAQVKGYVANNNKTYKMAEVKTLFQQGLDAVTAERWAHCVQHVIKEEDKMLCLDNLMDEVTERFIINTGNDDDDSDDENSSGERESN